MHKKHDKAHDIYLSICYRKIYLHVVVCVLQLFVGITERGRLQWRWRMVGDGGRQEMEDGMRWRMVGGGGW